MKALRIIFIVLFLGYFGCKKHVESLNKESVTKEVLKMFDEYHNAIKQKGLEAEFEYLDNSINFFWVPPGYTSALTYDSIKNILISNSKSIKSIEFSWDTIQIFPLTKIIASYSGIVNGKMIDTNNIQSIFKIIESGTVIKRSDKWKLLNGQSRNLILTDSL